MVEIYSDIRSRVLLRENKKRTWRKYHFLFTDLQHASLAGVDMQDCTFECCRLDGANFVGAKLQGAKFMDCSGFRTNFTDAEMQECCIDNTELTDERDELGVSGFSRCLFDYVRFNKADLQHAVLRSCDLSGASLHRAKVGTDILKRFNSMKLTNAIGVPKAITAAVPVLPEGKFTGWKRCADGRIVELQIPESARRSAGLSRKMRAEAALTVSILSPRFQWCKNATSQRNTGGSDCQYRVGFVTKADRWDPDPWTVCTHGIHFFLTREEAVAYSRN